jgi:C4-dicarboxylate-specific signal transduction histidine kinase
LDFNRVLEALSKKFCEPGQSVHLGAQAINGGLEISVRDTGPGIRAEELLHLFEPYAKLSNKPTGGEKSMGLGLSIVREIGDLTIGALFHEGGHPQTLPLQRATTRAVKVNPAFLSSK